MGVGSGPYPDGEGLYQTCLNLIIRFRVLVLARFSGFASSVNCC